VEKLGIPDLTTEQIEMLVNEAVKEAFEASENYLRKLK
jgi:hypothetical protein